MTSPVLSFKRQGQLYKRKGAASQAGYDGAYTAETFAIINAAAGGDREVVAAVAGARIRVLSYSVSAPAGGGTAVFKSASTAISPTITLGANAFVSEAHEAGLFETAEGEALNVTPVTSTMGVRVTYILVD